MSHVMYGLDQLWFKTRRCFKIVEFSNSLQTTQLHNNRNQIFNFRWSKSKIDTVQLYIIGYISLWVKTKIVILITPEPGLYYYYYVCIIYRFSSYLSTE